MERAVGGAYLEEGQFQSELVLANAPDTPFTLVDVGCGSGRAAFALKDVFRLLFLREQNSASRSVSLVISRGGGPDFFSYPGFLGPVVSLGHLKSLCNPCWFVWHRGVSIPTASVVLRFDIDQIAHVSLPGSSVSPRSHLF